MNSPQTDKTESATVVSSYGYYPDRVEFQKEGRTFLIEATLATSVQGVQSFYPRVFEGGIVLNDGDMPACRFPEQAIDYGLYFVRKSIFS